MRLLTLGVAHGFLQLNLTGCSLRGSPSFDPQSAPPAASKDVPNRIQPASATSRRLNWAALAHLIATTKP